MSVRFSGPEVWITPFKNGSKVPLIFWLPTLIPDMLLDRVKALSTNHEDEALVVLAHGDEMTSPLWDKLMKRIIIYICGKTGILCADYGFIHVDQTCDTHGIGMLPKRLDIAKKCI